MKEYRRKSTILGDKDIWEWQREIEDKVRIRRRKEKEKIIDKIPERIKSKPFSGVEKGWLLKGMPLHKIYQRRMRRQ